MKEGKRPVIRIFFIYTFLLLTLSAFAIGIWLFNDIKRDRLKDLNYSSAVIKRYYELSFRQWSNTLLSLGQQLAEVKGENAQVRRIDLARKANSNYKELLAFGFADTTGQVLVFSEANVGDSLPHLMLSENSKRSFLKAKQVDNISIGEAYYFPNVVDWILPIRVPIRDSLNNLIALNTTALQYNSLNQELLSFGFDSTYRIHLINKDFNTTQLYYPLPVKDYVALLRKEASIYTELSENEIADVKYYNGFNTFENHASFLIKADLIGLNHELVVSVNQNVLWAEMIPLTWIMLAIYILLSAILWITYFYTDKKEKQYFLNIEKEKNFSSNIIDSSPIIILGLDKNYDCSFINPAGTVLLEYQKDQIKKSNLASILFPNLSQDKIEIFWNTGLINNKDTYTGTLLTSSGQEKSINWQLVKRHVSDEIEILFFGIDETDKKIAQKQLIEREANLKAIFESTQSLIALFDKDKMLVEFNQPFAQYAKEVENITLTKGMDIFAAMNSTLVEEWKRFQDRALNGEKFQETVEYPTDTDTLYFLFSYNPIYQNGEVTGSSLFIEDITLLKQAQAKLERYTENLEEIVKERTEALEEKNVELKKGNDELAKALENLKTTQQQLLKAEKMASLGVLAAGIGHEINNPLNFIQNGLSALIQELNNSKLNKEIENLKPYIDIINDGVNRARKIVKSLSHFSRQQMSMDEKCDLYEIIDNCLEILKNNLKHKVSVSKEYQEGNAIVKGNEGRLHQAFLNILSNAEQAIEKSGNIRIIIKQKGDILEVSIMDDGSGISEENLSKIGDPFFTTKDPGKGTGLGLFITNSIIEEHNGEVSVKSEINKGTTFTIRFH
ncbi:ATP-binding protein [Fulvivirga sp.]|uniref:ATP-binding protein n=1 Tax=Fulvivirga sp. TaxID=1931237 RepID=UPI0032F0449E